MTRLNAVVAPIVHEVHEISADFDRFAAALEKLLGRFDPGVQALFTTDAKAAVKRIEAMEGEQGLMIFDMQNHGALLAVVGQPAKKAKRYHIGNPLIAAQMTRHDIRAGLYAPLTVFVYEVDPGRIRVEYDQPSSQFGQFKNAAVIETAMSLDGKLIKLIEKAAKLAS
jgi:uncharacterized protein (DUF302 family)